MGKCPFEIATKIMRVWRANYLEGAKPLIDAYLEKNFDPKLEDLNGKIAAGFYFLFV